MRSAAGSRLHYAELWYVFNHLDQGRRNWTAADRKLAEGISSYWVNFAKSGNPNGASLPTWPAFTSPDGRCCISAIRSPWVEW